MVSDVRMFPDVRKFPEPTGVRMCPERTFQMYVCVFAEDVCLGFVFFLDAEVTTMQVLVEPLYAIYDGQPSLSRCE